MSGIVPTSEQQAAIEHNAGPLRIAAGAGTGKTTTIVERLAAVLDQGVVDPEAVLGITFTNKAAEELGDRIRRRLPDLEADGRTVEVTTYHGFAFTLLQEFGSYVGVERTSKVIGPGYVRQLLLESLGSAVPGVLDLTTTPTRVADLARLAGGISDHARTPHDLIAGAPSSPDDVWTARLELLGILEVFGATKLRLGVLDYGDLISKALEAVTRFPMLAERVRSRYRMLLLDEYQDTNPAQRLLLSSLFGNGFPVTAVGDIDQTIYEWRGASLSNFNAFPTDFLAPGGAPAPTVRLTVNRRSGQQILDIANDIRANLHDDPHEGSLVATVDAVDASITAGWFNSLRDEAHAIAAEAVRLHDEEGVPWRSMAVLFRSNRHIPLVRDAMAAADVPVEVASLGGLLKVPEVAQIHAWLRILSDPSDSAALMRVLLGSRYRLGLGDIAPLVGWLSDTVRDDPDEEEPWPLLEGIDRIDEIPDLAAEPRTRLEAFRGLYRRLLTEAQGVTLVELCRRILDSMGAWHEVESMTEAAGLSARLNLYRFLDLAESWSPLEGRPSLEAFVGYLGLLDEEAAADELDTATVGSEDAVSLLTVHRSKGLEWDTVFVPVLTSGVFPSRYRGYTNPHRTPSVLPHEYRRDLAAVPELTGDATADGTLLSDHHKAGEWRTAYVAVTRAARRLYVSGAFWTGGVRMAKPSELFELARAHATTDRWTILEEAGTAPERMLIDDTDGAPDPVFGDGGWQDALRRAVEDPGSVVAYRGAEAAYDAEVDQMRMMLEGLPEPPEVLVSDETATTSVTSLVTMATCPLRYFWTDVDPLPRRPGLAARRGTEIHRKIEMFNRGVVALEDAEGAYDLVPDDTSGGGAVGDAFATFAASRWSTERPLRVEVPIRIPIGEAVVRGRVDAVYGTDDQWEIVDFKSGRAPADHGSAARVQLQAYAIAVANHALGPPPPRFSAGFVYLGGDDVVERFEDIDEPWLHEAEERLGLLVEAISGPTYTPTPSPSCRHCDFVTFCDDGQSYLAGQA